MQQSDDIRVVCKKPFVTVCIPYKESTRISWYCPSLRQHFCLIGTLCESVGYPPELAQGTAPCVVQLTPKKYNSLLYKYL